MNARVEKIFKLPFYQRLLLLVLVLALVGTGFYFMFYAPLLEESARLEREQESLTARLENNRRIARNLDQVRAEYNSLQAQLAKALIELPHEKEIPTLLTNISSLAREQGLEILMFRPMGEVNRGFYAEVPVDIRLTGSFHDVAMFFYNVGQLPRIVNISNLSMESTRAADGSTQLRVDCRATTFRFVESPAERQGG
ncbi:type 4a pilus biogenesis protein PilO [Geoalkalibacter halelectricus]|uniref:Type 4a pilus biogenesis protein PilO n=1 Tax=Geoalkalibacter halelectricus TaxID=2847045 RepID=A0ABY5ZQ46_9BACT|nr:type 4a pilus biogenesis protein PilO [Geoalkalibacter halelectricus]MDO3376767.1 type 4a pilus biogenesis protein PilO [Geoalkalibacter halelectricus]UWZ81282.1 type 4a pilus biogenesis protein PilO [Geoalkalibacter halelectricus]